MNKTKLKCSFIRHAVPYMKRPVTQADIEEAWTEFMKEVDMKGTSRAQQLRWTSSSGIAAERINRDYNY